MIPRVIVLALLLLAADGTAQTVHHVKSTAPGPGSGTAADPYASIQTGINAAANGDTVLVHPGTYFETIDFGGRDIVVRSVAGAGATTIDAAQADRVVRFTSGETAAAVLEGFTLENGFSANGGAITCELASSPTIRGCIIRDNEAGVAGGAVHVTGNAAPTFDDCDIVDNLAQVSGGAFVAHNTAMRIENCRIVGNFAVVGAGGGISISNSTGASIVDSLFEENFAGDAGGAIDMFQSSIAIERTRISGNAADNGGGVHAFNSAPTIVRCKIVANTATTAGGGIFSSIGTPVVRDTMLVGNTANDGGAMLEFGGSSVTMAGCTLAANSAFVTGGGVAFTAAGSPVYANSVFWGNAPDQLAPFSGTSLSVTFCDVQGGFTGTGNIASDPLFVDPTGNDIRLAAGSPCLEAGSTPLATTAADLEGNPRVFGADVDMGADERVSVLAGTGDDLELAVLVDGLDGGVRTKTVNPGQMLRFEMSTPGGTFSGVPPIVLGQAYAPGTPPVGGLLPELHLDFPGLVLFFDGTTVPAPFGPVTLELTPFALNAVAPPFGGAVVRSQLIVTTPLANNSIYAMTDAFDIIFP